MKMSTRRHNIYFGAYATITLHTLFPRFCFVAFTKMARNLPARQEKSGCKRWDT